MFYFIQIVNGKIESLMQFEKPIYSGNSLGQYNMWQNGDKLKVIRGQKMMQGRFIRTYSNEGPGISGNWKKTWLAGDLHDLIIEIFEKVEK